MKIVVVILVITVFIGLFMEAVAVNNDTVKSEEPGNAKANVLGGKIAPTPAVEHECPNGKTWIAGKCRATVPF